MHHEGRVYADLADRLALCDAPSGYALIAEIALQWGDLLLKAGEASDGKRIASDLWHILQRPEYAFTDAPPLGNALSPRQVLTREECVVESRKWASEHSEQEYPEAIAAFVDVVYSWLHQVDLTELQVPDRSLQDKRKRVYSWWGAWLGVDWSRCWYLCIVPDRWGKDRKNVLMRFSDAGNDKTGEVLSKTLPLLDG